MPKPKLTIQLSDPQHEALEAKVDAMMDVNATQPEAVAVKIEEPTPVEEPLDIFVSEPAPIEIAPTAPLVPGGRKVSEPVLHDVVAPKAVAPAEPLVSDFVVEPLRIDTPQTDAAIDDIVAQEADEVLAAQDAGIEAQIEAVDDAKSPQKHGHPFFWFFVILLVIVIAVIVVILTSPGLSPSFAP